MATARELKQRVEQIPIEQIIARFVHLKRSGANLLGLCPFHNERTPSFTVSPTKHIYKCFGCGASGDSIGFVMQHQQLGFMEALAQIAQWENIPVSYEPEPNKSQKNYMADVLRNLKTVSKDVLSRTLGSYEANPFYLWVAQLMNHDWMRAMELMMKFYVGTARNGGTIFWQVDQFMRVRTGAKIHYGADGHRRKDVPVKRLFQGRDGFQACLFGEHQLLQAPPGARVGVVESEKTAILCEVYEVLGPGAVYVASCGADGLTDEKIWALKGMPVVLIPDFSFTARAIWGVVPMRKWKNEKGHLVPDSRGEEVANYVSVAQRFQTLGCPVSFFDPCPERSDGADIGDLLVEGGAPAVRLAEPKWDELILADKPFE